MFIQGAVPKPAALKPRTRSLPSLSSFELPHPGPVAEFMSQMWRRELIVPHHHPSQVLPPPPDLPEVPLLEG